MEVARHFAEAMTLLRRRESNPVDPATLAGAEVEAVMQMNEASSTTSQTVEHYTVLLGGHQWGDVRACRAL